MVYKFLRLKLKFIVTDDHPPTFWLSTLEDQGLCPKKLGLMG